MCTGAIYLGVYIGDDVSKGDCLKKLMEKWEREIRSLIKIEDKYTQGSYAAVDRVVQLEWIFLQCVTKDTGQELTGMEKVLRENFLPCIFFGD